MRKLLLGGGACLLLLQACQTGGETISQTVHQESSPDFVSCIQPFEGLEIKPQVFEIEAGEKSVIKLKNGGKIEFPANAFVDASGKAVHGKVDVSWTEYHSLTDIMLSGIPMKYDSAGVQHDFQSGGMFTIKASQKDKDWRLPRRKKRTSTWLRSRTRLVIRSIKSMSNPGNGITSQAAKAKKSRATQVKSLR